MCPTTAFIKYIFNKCHFHNGLSISKLFLANVTSGRSGRSQLQNFKEKSIFLNNFYKFSDNQKKLKLLNGSFEAKTSTMIQNDLFLETLGFLPGATIKPVTLVVSGYKSLE